MRRRSIRTHRSGSRCPTTSPPPCIRTTTTRSLAASSTARCPRPTSSPAFGRTRSTIPRMAKFLSQEWLDLQKIEAQSLPERTGATARMQYKIAGAPDGDVAFYTVIENGKIVENSFGEDPDAEFTRAFSYKDFVNTA